MWGSGGIRRNSHGFQNQAGSLLYPGREKCGFTEVGQIGIEELVLSEIAVHTFPNVPSLWHRYFPDPETVQTEHARRHTLALSGGLANSDANRLMPVALLFGYRAKRSTLLDRGRFQAT